MKVIRIKDEAVDFGHAHIEAPIDMSTYLTLCGWVDVNYDEEDDGVPDCPICLAIVAYCKRLRLPARKERLGDCA